MMNDLLLTWSDAGRGGHIRNPAWNEIEERLLISLASQGVVGVEGETEGGLGRSIQVRSEGGKYLLTFGYETETDWLVRAYQNGEPSCEDVIILGDVWRNNLVCRDSIVIRQAFRQFFDTGAVSDILMRPAR